jgi:adenylate kinase
MNLVLLGAPGAGKGTQAQKLVAEFGFAHISTGDLLRGAIAAGSPLGLEAKGCMDAGQLVPDELVLSLLKERLASDDVKNGFILDGYPRNTAQAVTLDGVLAEMGKNLDAALLVAVDPSIIVDRLSRRRACKACGFTGNDTMEVCPRCGGEMYQRDDDKPATIQNRLDTYAVKTAPLIDYFKGQDKLVEVDGQAAADDVYVQVKEVLGL